MDCPRYDEAEITIIGTGGGYGESVVAHIGDGEWLIVDSCINPVTKAPLPLEYLEGIGVDLKTQVKLIICTHWHDDHIQGISTVLENCPGAVFSMARAHDLKKFLRLVSLDYQKLKKVSTNSATNEFNRCLDILLKRKATAKASDCDKILYQRTVGIPVTVAALSPSDEAIHRFDAEVSKLITGFGSPSKRIQPLSPNAKSVVLLIKYGNSQRVILGADLEVDNNPNLGWLHILDQSQVIDGKASYFKIPHHGSLNGYHQRIWSELLEEDPTTSITPWNRNNKLPEPSMLEKYCSHSPYVFITSAVKTSKPKERDRMISKMIKRMNYKLKEVKYEKGIIRSRLNLTNSNAKWEVKLFDSAFHVNPILGKLILQ